MPTTTSLLIQQAQTLLTDEPNPITVLSNATALLNSAMVDLNWVGFYFYEQRSQTLTLGPFQGNVACTHIAPGQGVVGTSYNQRQALVVPDVHAFAGHIACDAASNAEIVVPLMGDDTVIGILDVDSPKHGRFDDTDLATLTEFAAVLMNHLDVQALKTIY